MTLENICRPIHSGSSQNPMVGFQHVYIFIAMHVTPINHSLFQSWNSFLWEKQVWCRWVPNSRLSDEPPQTLWHLSKAVDLQLSAVEIVLKVAGCLVAFSWGGPKICHATWTVLARTPGSKTFVSWWALWGRLAQDFKCEPRSLKEPNSSSLLGLSLHF